MGGHARASTEEKHILSPIKGPTAVSVVHRETVVKRLLPVYLKSGPAGGAIWERIWRFLGAFCLEILI